MSDTFDHASDAFESQYYDDGYRGGGSSFTRNPYHYHSGELSLEIVAETTKAFLLKYEGKEKWVPKTQVIFIRRKDKDLTARIWLKAFDTGWEEPKQYQRSKQ